EVEDVGGAKDVDPVGDGLGHGEVVDRGEVPDVVDLAGELRVVSLGEAEARLRDVAGDEATALGEAGVIAVELAQGLFGLGAEVLLDEEDEASVAVLADQPVHELLADEAREAREEDVALHGG